MRKVGDAKLTASDDCSLKIPATTCGDDAIAASAVHKKACTRLLPQLTAEPWTRGRTVTLPERKGLGTWLPLQICGDVTNANVAKGTTLSRKTLHGGDGEGSALPMERLVHGS